MRESCSTYTSGNIAQGRGNVHHDVAVRVGDGHVEALLQQQLSCCNDGAHKLESSRSKQVVLLHEEASHSLLLYSMSCPPDTLVSNAFTGGNETMRAARTSSSSTTKSVSV